MVPESIGDVTLELLHWSEKAICFQRYVFCFYDDNSPSRRFLLYINIVTDSVISEIRNSILMASMKTSNTFIFNLPIYFVQKTL